MAWRDPRLPCIEFRRLTDTHLTCSRSFGWGGHFLQWHQPRWHQIVPTGAPAARRKGQLYTGLASKGLDAARAERRLPSFPPGTNEVHWTGSQHDRGCGVLDGREREAVKNLLEPLHVVVWETHATATRTQPGGWMDGIKLHPPKRKRGEHERM